MTTPRPLLLRGFRLAVLLAVCALTVVVTDRIPVVTGNMADVYSLGEDVLTNGKLTTQELIGLIGDCEVPELPPRCGDPPARWSTVERPVAICTFQSGRPPWLAEAQFRQMVVDAAAQWNDAEAAIGIRYNGDCASGARWGTSNRRNEIGFDDERDRVSGRAVAVTLTNTSWSPPINPAVRNIIETDIVVSEIFGNIPECLVSTLVHEMGHAIGFGHSTDINDVMYPSLNSFSAATCRAAPSSAEVSRLRELYGLNLRPRLSTQSAVAAAVGALVSLNALAIDPENEAVTYEWIQTSGHAVALQPGSTGQVNFTAPVSASILEFRVTARDRYLHPASATVRVTVTGVGTISGTLPQSGLGLFVFNGGTSDQLLATAACPQSTAVFWSLDADGQFVAYVPGTTVSSVNAAWLAKFPGGLPAGTPLLGRCR